jgi:hypothetical protein
VIEVLCTSFLWHIWLAQDMSNIAIYFRRSLSVGDLILTLASISLFLAYIVYNRGEKVQTIVDQK